MEHWNALKKARIQSAENQLVKNSERDFNSIAGPVEAYLPQTSEWELLLPARSEVPPLAKDSRKIISESTPSPETVTRDRRLVEIRSSSDPQLKKVLEHLLQKSREEQTRLTIAVVSQITSTPDKIVNWFSPMIDQIIEQSEVEDLKGFATDAGELALMFYDVDRSDIAYWLRESFSKLRSSSFQNSLHSEASEQLIAGVAMVNAPSRSFEIDQLIDAAWRCRDGAAIQGVNAVKTIEVY